MLTGAMLAAVASLLTGATRLQRAIISAAAASQEGGQISEASPIWPIYAPIKVRVALSGNPSPWSIPCSGRADTYIDYDSSRQSYPVAPPVQAEKLDWASLLQGLPGHQKIVSDVSAAIGEDMQVRDTASEEVRRTRNKCRTLEGRLRAILKGASNEVSEQVDSRSMLRQASSCTGKQSAIASAIVILISCS